MQWVRDYKPQPGRDSQFKRALIITIAGNIFLAASKGLAAYLSGSAAIYADAANSISDVFYSLLMVLGLWMAQKPPDLTHPQGHSRFEPVVGMVVTFSMTFAGYEAARTAVARFISGGQAVDLGLPAMVLLVSAGVKAGMFYFLQRIARSVGSPALSATAQDNLSDVLTSIAAFLGVIGSNLVHPLLDPIGGLLVSLWIFRTVFNTGRENFNYLTGAGATPEMRDQIVNIAESVPGVLRVHHTMTEYVGPRLVVDLHINVEGTKSLNEVHAISDEVINRLEELGEIDRAYVHIEPDDWE